MEKLKHKLNSVRIKLFLTLGLAVIVIIVVLILLNNVVLETFYLFSKQNTLKNVYEKVNADYKNLKDTTKIEEDLKKIAIRNNFDILLATDTGISVYTSNKDFMNTIAEIGSLTTNNEEDTKILYAEKNVKIQEVKVAKSDITYMLLSGKLDNEYMLYIRLPISSI